MMWHHGTEHSSLVTSHHATRLRCPQCVLPSLEICCYSSHKASDFTAVVKAHLPLWPRHSHTQHSGSLNTLMSKLDVLTRIGGFWLHCVYASQVSGCFLKSPLIPSLTFPWVRASRYFAFCVCECERKGES